MSPFYLGQLRHLYTMMLNGEVTDAAEAARGLLGPAIADEEREPDLSWHDLYLTLRKTLTERAAATARAERAEAELTEARGHVASLAAMLDPGNTDGECAACHNLMTAADCGTYPTCCDDCIISEISRVSIAVDAGEANKAIAAKVTTERARVVEAIAAYVVHIAGRETANAMALGDGTWRVIASVCGDLADHIRSHNWAPPEEESK